MLPDSQRIEIADASHLMHEEQPTASNEAVLAFVTRAASRHPVPSLAL